ncbi:hypothetical protein INT44_004995 [Umbelopsis vinacea]|uniref:Uncharacterized protein n=1 Tax=Umbelopsis vinacea TaxID=44442 RepID=A0A8H7UL88_9FUNG|nr:hypothetical protein INT44_004995 [Umbelopsis vinacea]
MGLVCPSLAALTERCGSFTSISTPSSWEAFQTLLDLEFRPKNTRSDSQGPEIRHRLRLPIIKDLKKHEYRRHAASSRRHRAYNHREYCGGAIIPVTMEPVPVTVDPLIKALVKQNQGLMEMERDRVMTMEKLIKKDNMTPRNPKLNHKISMPETYGGERDAKVIYG